MGLRVIGAGLSRTGTLSMKAALEQLGFAPAYHMAEVVLPRPGVNDGHLDLWHDHYVHGTPLDYAAIFRGYRAAFDAPACHHWRELRQAFPDAKVILTVRDPQPWADSWAALWASLDDARRPEKVRRYHRYPPLLDGILARHYGGLDRARNLETFHAHNAAVRAAVPPAQLLEFDVREGWAPLCAFLGVPVPAGDFPRRNERATMDPLLHAVLSTDADVRL